MSNTAASRSTPEGGAYSRIAERILAWKRPLLVSHAKPDGDALGSLAAMRQLLRGRGADPCALLFDEIPHRYSLFRSADRMPILGKDLYDRELADFDGVIILDTCAYGQLAPIADWLRASKTPKVAVDHHATRDELAGDYLIDETAAANCLILYELAAAEDWLITPQTAEAMYVGIAMDTGWFRHSNTDARVFRAAADLVALGVQPHELHQELYMKETPARIALLGAALGTMKLLCDEQLSVMTLSCESMANCGASPADTEDIVNEPLRIESVTVSVLLVEQADGPVRCSFRSKPPTASPIGKGELTVASDDELRPTSSPHTKGELAGASDDERRPTASHHTKGELAGASDDERRPTASPLTKGGLRGVDNDIPTPRKRMIDVNVAAIAQSFGGGGHARAAGARIEGTLEEVRQAIIGRISTEWAPAS